MKSKKELEAFKTLVIVKLTLLIGACRIPSIKKKDIEASLEKFIKDLDRLPLGK